MARPSSKFAEINDQQQRDDLTKMWQSHHCHYTRLRAHAILLSDRGKSIRQIVDMLGVDRNSVASWIDRFDNGGPAALQDRERPGAPPVLNDQELRVLDELFDLYPNQPSKVLAELKLRTGKRISQNAMRRYARRLGRSWKRPRRSLREKRDENAFRLAREEIERMIQQPEREVVFFDEAGSDFLSVASCRTVGTVGENGSRFRAAMVAKAYRFWDLNHSPTKHMPTSIAER
ncbi:MAG: helix-turn-helix domain-containing protein [Pirellulaceae bacterium]